MLIYCSACNFQDPKVSQGKVRTINRRGGVLNHFWWHIYAVIFVPKITGIGQLLLKLSLVVGYGGLFWDTV